MNKLTAFFSKIEVWLQSLPWDTRDDDFACVQPPTGQRLQAWEFNDSLRQPGVYGALYEPSGRDHMPAVHGTRSHDF